MSKTVLMLVGVVLILMGSAGLVPSWTLATEPGWHAVVKVVIGLVAVVVAMTDKPKAV
jgi:hypothetical protein